MTPKKDHHCILEDVKPDFATTNDLPANTFSFGSQGTSQSQNFSGMGSSSQQPSGSQAMGSTFTQQQSSTSPKVLAREREYKYRYYGGGAGASSGIHKIVPQSFGSKWNDQVSTGTGEAPSKKKSFYEKVFNYEFREKPDSKEFGEFLSSLKDQLVLAKRINQNTAKFIDNKKNIRLKRDFKSRFLHY